MTTVVRPAIVKRIASARELGDLKENSDYHEARREQSFAEGRVQQIEDLLRRAVLIPADESADGGGTDGASGGVGPDGRARGMETRRATIGSTVVVEDPHGEEATYRIVGPAEADVGAGRISDVSPLGAALLGRAAGEEVEIVVPSGRRIFRVVEVR
jgi:transcription elongation factor GreA